MEYILYIIIVAFQIASITGNDAANLQTLQDDFWKWRMKENPSYSSYVGVTEFNDKMEEFGLEQFARRRNDALEFHYRLSSIKREELDTSGQVNYDILKDTLDTFLSGNKWAEYSALSPISFLGGIQIYGGPYFAGNKSLQDYENFISRLHAVQNQVDGIKELGRRAIDLGRTLHNVSMIKVPGQLDAKIFNNSEDSPYFGPFKDLANSTDKFNETVRNDIIQRGREAVEAYINAFRDLKDFIVDEYMPNTREEYGVYAWDPTNQFYRECIIWHLSFNMTPEEVHQVGLDEVDRISTDMNKIMNKIGFDGTIAEFFRSLVGDPRFYSNDTDYILKTYNDTVFQRINPKLNTIFKNIPDVPLLIKASTTDGIGGGYSSASENSPGVFTINLFRPMEVPFFEMMALSLHEANPGHHMQHSYSMKANLPKFREDQILSFYNIPNWFPYYSSYGEGWGLYSEYLGEEMGLYKDDYEMMGRYSYEILRASRLVVDTGLHYKKWSRQQAIEYLENHTALIGGSSANEIDRYITWPGQACAYKLGEIKMKQLRQKAESELGSNFDVKEFHLHILENGAMPMSVLERLVDSWIEERKVDGRTSSCSHCHVTLLQITIICTVTNLLKMVF
ncbi:hypothetical protein ACF0H5_020655 [Mactra antiquata]